MKASLRTVDDHGTTYTALMFWCPGCERPYSDGRPHQAYGGLHMLPVNSPQHQPSWDWDGNIEEPTLSPSILTRGDRITGAFVCHSFIRGGMIEFLGDCTHELAGKTVPLGELPYWVIR